MENSNGSRCREVIALKSVFLTMGLFICSIISIVIVMTFSGSMIRQNELEHAVELALMNTVKNQWKERTYSVTNNDELLADFLEELLVQVTSDATIQVNVLEIDYEKGLLSVEVIENYVHPIGTNGQISVNRTVVMEQYSVGD